MLAFKDIKKRTKSWSAKTKGSGGYALKIGKIG